MLLQFYHLAAPRIMDSTSVTVLRPWVFPLVYQYFVLWSCHEAGRGRLAASLLHGFGILRPDRWCRACRSFIEDVHKTMYVCVTAGSAPTDC